MSLARRLARAFLWPIRRILDPRFADVTRRVSAARTEIAREGQDTRSALGNVTTEINQVVGTYTSASVESNTYIGAELRDVNAHLDSVDAKLRDLREELSPLANEVAERRYADRLGKLSQAALSDLDAPAAGLLNYAEGHRGFAAQADLWLNPPIYLVYSEESVRLASVNERIVEVPFAMRALAHVKKDARLLDFGSSESSLALSLASLGYRVTALDLRKYPFEHPNLEIVASPLEEWDAEPRSFDAVLSVSTLEHVGLGWYGEEPGEPDADRAALRRIGELLDAEGILVLTVPYGKSEVDQVQRRYDRSGLDELLNGWNVLERTVIEQRDDLTWSPVEESDGTAVAMVVAQLSAGP